MNNMIPTKLKVALASWTVIAALSATAWADETTAKKPVVAASKDTARLLWIPCKYGGPEKDKLRASEKLTVEEYRKRGVDVVEMKWADLDKWREGDGKDYAKANKYLQYVAYAKGQKVDAVGGLTTFEVTPEMAEGLGKKAGDLIHGWGIALSGCTSNFMFNFDTAGDELGPIPMALVDGDPWAIPSKIDPKSCSAGGEQDFMAQMSKGRPFVGVGLNGNTVANVVGGSPAQQAGLASGDLLVSVAGKQINNLGDLASILDSKKPGDEAEVEYERGGKRSKTTIKLADRGELESRNAPDGKPLPDLSGKDINGKEVRLAELKGKVVLLDFWATWCGPCIEELPLMQLTWDTLKDKGLAWVGVSGDTDESAWREFVKENRMGGTQLRDEEWMSAMAVNGFPTVFLVDKQGVVNCRARGGTVAQVAATLLQD